MWPAHALGFWPWGASVIILPKEKSISLFVSHKGRVQEHIYRKFELGDIWCFAASNRWKKLGIAGNNIIKFQAITHRDLIVALL